jgi:hypothetical protein
MFILLLLFFILFIINNIMNKTNHVYMKIKLVSTNQAYKKGKFGIYMSQKGRNFKTNIHNELEKYLK